MKRVKVAVFDENGAIDTRDLNADEKYSAIVGPSGEFVLGVPGESITVIASGQWTEAAMEWYAVEDNEGGTGDAED